MQFNIHPQPKQRKVLNLLRKTGSEVATILGFGGARGGAKSRLIRDASLLLALEEPGITIWIIMRNWGKLEENHLSKFRTERPAIMEYWSYQRKEFSFPATWGGSRIALKYADTDDQVRELTTGPEAKYIFIEQAEQFSQYQLQTIKSCNRWTGPGAKVGGSKVLMSFNPGGEGTSYLRRIFWLKQYEGEETAANFEFVQAYGWDNYEWFRNEVAGLTWEQFYKLDNEARFNLFITQTTEGRKMWAQPESIRMGDLYGRFDVFSGQYFASVWDERKCTISRGLAERLIQPWWMRWMSLDWGYGHHSACFWAAAGKVAPDVARELLGIDITETREALIVYRELVVNQTPEHDLAQRIVDLTPERERSEIRRWFVDSMVFGEERRVDRTIADIMQAVTKPAGLCKMEAAIKDRIAGARTVHDCFRRTSALRTNTADVGSGPILLIADSCPALMSALPVLICDPDRVEDVLKLETIEDDVWDGFRYLIESWIKAKPQAPMDVRAKELYNSVEDPTTRAIRMKEFTLKEQARTMPVGRRWRNA